MAACSEASETGGTKPPPDPHYRRRFSAKIISHGVWLDHVFSLSLRDVELLLAGRGVVVTYETVRPWCKKFGASFADRVRRRRPPPGDKWCMDEIFIRNPERAARVASAAARSARKYATLSATL